MQQLQAALAAHQSGRLSEAEELYRKVLQKEPQNPQALNLYGVFLRQKGEVPKAIELLKQAINLAPDDARAYGNLGNAFQEQGRFQEAIPLYRKALEIQKENPNIYNNLANALQASGALEEAVHTYRSALQIDPEFYPAYCHLGHCLAQLRRWEEAIVALQKALQIFPNAEAYYILGTVYKEQGDCVKAESAFEAALQCDPQHAQALHLLHALRGETTEKAPERYVVDLYDGFAETFDDLLVKQLDYCMPEAMAELLSVYCAPKNHLSVLDLGCGTGLSGIALQPWSKQLVGVDLSPKMLEKAAARKIYDQLLCCDLVAGCQGEHDLVAACDVLIYFGDLLPTFQAVQQVLRKKGLFILSVEVASESEEKWKLLANGRYAHALSYVESCAEKSGFDLLVHKELSGRREQGEAVQSALTVLQRC